MEIARKLIPCLKRGKKGQVHHSVKCGRVPNILEEVEEAEETWNKWWNKDGSTWVEDCLREVESPLIGQCFGVKVMREAVRSFKQVTASVDG